MEIGVALWVTIINGAGCVLVTESWGGGGSYWNASGLLDEGPIGIKDHWGKNSVSLLSSSSIGPYCDLANSTLISLLCCCVFVCISFNCCWVYNCFTITLAMKSFITFILLPNLTNRLALLCLEVDWVHSRVLSSWGRIGASGIGYQTLGHSPLELLFY